MKLKSFFTLLSAVIIISGTTSCKKVEGPGGSSSIIGKIHAEVFDGAGNKINEYDAEDYDVFIIYGGDEAKTFYDDDVKTSYDGTFRFNFLENGTYRVFVYTKCPTCPSGKDVIIKTVNIDSKKSEVDLGTINVRD